MIGETPLGTHGILFEQKKSFLNQSHIVGLNVKNAKVKLLNCLLFCALSKSHFWQIVLRF